MVSAMSVGVHMVCLPSFTNLTAANMTPAACLREHSFALASG